MRSRWVFIGLLLVTALTSGALMMGCGESAPADTTPPVTYADYPDGWTKGPVTVELSVEDDSCGPEQCKIFYSTNGGKSWKVGDSAKVKKQGKQRVLVYAEDAFGNKEDPGYCQLKIDNGCPTTKALNSPSIQKDKSVTLKYRIDDKTPRATAHLRLTGPKNRTINLGSEPTGKQRSVTFKASLPAGTYAWVVYAKDQAGNKATERVSGQLVVKAKPPDNSPRELLVGITETGECYHMLSCYHWTKDPGGNSKCTVSEARAMGFRPCRVCRPPS